MGADGGWSEGSTLAVQLSEAELRALGARALLRHDGFVKVRYPTRGPEGRVSQQTLWFVPQSHPDMTPLRQADIVERRAERQARDKVRKARRAEEEVQFETLVTQPEGGVLVELARNVVGGAGNVIKSGAGGVGAVLQTTTATVGTTVGELRQGNVLGAGSSLVTNIGKTAVTSVTAVAKAGIGGVREAVRGAGAVVDGATKVDPTQLLEPYLGWVQVSLAAKLKMLRPVHGVLTWADPQLTTWIVLLLCSLVLVLPWLPWLPIARVAGAALLGPHMYLYRCYYVDGAAPGPPELVDQYVLEHDPAKRQLLVSKARQQRKLEAKNFAKVEAQRKTKLPLAEHARARRERAEALGQRGHAPSVEVVPSRVGQRVLAFVPDKLRSSCLPPSVAYEYVGGPRWLM